MTQRPSDEPTLADLARGAEQERQPRDERDRSTRHRTRAADSRATMERPPMDVWAPPNVLETPSDGEYHFRWVAEYVNGAPTPRSVQMRLRQGYVRVHISELPEDFLVDEDLKGDGIARNGGLLLMKVPKAIVAQRDAYYRNRRLANVFAADALQGVAGKDAVQEDRGSRALEGADAGRALMQMSRG